MTEAGAAVEARAAAEAVARASYGKLVALLAARMRDVAGAEDALAEAFAAALVQWPAERRADEAGGLAAVGRPAPGDRRDATPAHRDRTRASISSCSRRKRRPAWMTVFPTSGSG